jgi:hypothetical protein
VKYDFMVRRYQNDFFHRIWARTAIRAAKASAAELTIPDIVIRIWTPAFEECCQILDSLNNCSITLREVDDRFLRFNNNISTLKFHLEQLHKGVEVCHDRPPPPGCPPWIDVAVERMQQYWTLSRYAEAAKTVLKLRDELMLTGDFALMETIAKKVLSTIIEICGILMFFGGTQMSSSMKDKPLDVIDQSLINAGEFLGMVEGKRLDCLHTFAESLEVVEWIRTETKG